MKMEHRFVECIPETVESGILYVSPVYATAIHLCVCGCGREVVTPLSPTDWRLLFDGETVSLTPSIGNWSFACRSHYFITQNRIDWAGEMPQQVIDNNRAYDRRLKSQRYEKQIDLSKDTTNKIVTKNNTPSNRNGFLGRIVSFFKRIYKN